MFILGTEYVADDGVKSHLLLSGSAGRITAESVCHEFRMWFFRVFGIKQRRMDIGAAVIESRE